MRFCCLLVAWLAWAAAAADWPQWRGSERTGVSPEEISVRWPAKGPRQVWQADVGLGHAAPSVARGRVVTLGYTGKGDTVWCLDAATGEVRWRHEYAALPRLKGEPGKGEFDGPHATPVLHAGRVYTLSRDGKVHCLDLEKGTVHWKRELCDDLQAKLPECGFAGSPLFLDGKVIVNVCESGTALDAQTGEVRWKSGPAIAGYAAPVARRVGQDRWELLLFGFKSLLAVNAADGQVRWSLPWPTRYGANAADPQLIGDGVFITSAYGRGCALVDLGTGAVRWKNMTLAAQCSPVVVHEGRLYGFHGYIDYPKDQALVCLDPAAGKELWRQKAMAGQLILAAGRLVMLLTTGELVVAEASADGYREHTRAKMSEPERCPVPPVLAGGRLYLRAGKGRLVCLDVTP